ncbi:monomeric [FeFe] hydrogenase [Lentimicrobium sp. S6]|uniref:monomeric [FeFe] hydrogenase n=1 Tax=Lentimicrobium sp. S6 TaxID=2735872 RepID=UPI0015538A67|nr:monomeric [FeFe] hydrogenase [Lentimicrobium sp. S6]NPD47020.1 4Fe-4S binding protein [Lentimicrobium sp. S6]
MIKNNAMFIRRELLTRLCSQLQDGGSRELIDRIPLEMKPRNNSHIRCCVHKDRAVLKYKLMACLGFSIEDETDELTPLSEYVKIAEEKQGISDVRLTVVDEACLSCSPGNYVVTNMCQSCDGRPCQVNCPKDAINFSTGRAQIDTDDCINCGLCMNYCPFHAIIFTPVPCEAVCPVDAISKDKNGIANINHDLCIFCGRCFEACPYGAVMEKSHIVNIYQALKSEEEIIALVAPALYGQFAATPEQVHAAILKLGFDKVVEVAEGAIITAQKEAQELEEEILGNPDKKMTTSCCPSYQELVIKHLPTLKDKLSTTKTPLYYTSEKLKQENHEAKMVFISPCMAKKHEVFSTQVADYTLNFEELGSMLAASEIEMHSINIAPKKDNLEARVFSYSGGVTEMVKNYLISEENLNNTKLSGFSKENIKELKALALGKGDYNFYEIMACENGCINGCNTIAKPSMAKRQILKYSTNN